MISFFGIIVIVLSYVSHIQSVAVEVGESALSPERGAVNATYRRHRQSALRTPRQHQYQDTERFQLQAQLQNLLQRRDDGTPYSYQMHTSYMQQPVDGFSRFHPQNYQEYLQQQQRQSPLQYGQHYVNPNEKNHNKFSNFQEYGFERLADNLRLVAPISSSPAVQNSFTRQQQLQQEFPYSAPSVRFEDSTKFDLKHLENHNFNPSLSYDNYDRGALRNVEFYRSQYNPYAFGRPDDYALAAAQTVTSQQLPQRPDTHYRAHFEHYLRRYPHRLQPKFV